MGGLYGTNAAMSDQQFTCKECNTTFTVPQAALERYPGWKPSVCLKCRDKKKSATKRRSASKGKARVSSSKKGGAKRKGSVAGADLTLEQVLDQFTDGPFEGVFTDGACSGNPGRGGWGMVWVEDNEVKHAASGGEEKTTNNRMELRALIEAYRTVPEDVKTTIYTDSNLCVKTINEWAKGWKARGWKRKTGPVENLELVREAYELSLTRPKIKLTWIKAHNGSRWNEYADSLATSYQRDAAKRAAAASA